MLRVHKLENSTKLYKKTLVTWRAITVLSPTYFSISTVSFLKRNRKTKKKTWNQYKKSMQAARIRWNQDYHKIRPQGWKASIIYEGTLLPDFSIFPGKNTDVTHINHGSSKISEEGRPMRSRLKFNVSFSLLVIQKRSIGFK